MGEPRKRIEFWLWTEREADLLQTVAELKAARKFAKTIRDGIRLIVDLRKGNTDVLAELFPWAVAQPAPGATRTARDNGAGEGQDLSVLAASIETLATAVAAWKPPVDQPNRPRLAPSAADDEIDNQALFGVKQAEISADQAAQASQNFLASLGALQ